VAARHNRLLSAAVEPVEDPRKPPPLLVGLREHFQLGGTVVDTGEPHAHEAEGRRFRQAARRSGPIMG